MNLAVISAAGWTQHRHAAEQFLKRFATAGDSDTILIDASTIARENESMGAASPSDRSAGTMLEESAIRVVPFAEWMKDQRVSQDRISPVAIHASANDIDDAHIVVVDARHYHRDLIASALREARSAWYPLDRWHPAFAVVCDDTIALHVVQTLAATFYLQPQALTQREAKAIVRAVMRRAFVYRWFGARAGRVVGWVDKTAKRAKSLKTRLEGEGSKPPEGVSR